MKQHIATMPILAMIAASAFADFESDAQTIFPRGTRYWHLETESSFKCLNEDSTPRFLQSGSISNVLLSSSNNRA